MSVKLGTVVTDKITKFKGIAVSKTYFLYGCIKVEVQPEELKDGNRSPSEFIDEVGLQENNILINSEVNNYLDKTLTDSITKLSGVCIAYTEYLYSSPRVTLQPKGIKDGLPLPSYTIELL